MLTLSRSSSGHYLRSGYFEYFNLIVSNHYCCLTIELGEVELSAMPLSITSTVVPMRSGSEDRKERSEFEDNDIQIERKIVGDGPRGLNLPGDVSKESRQVQTIGDRDTSKRCWPKPAQGKIRQMGLMPYLRRRRWTIDSAITNNNVLKKADIVNELVSRL
ncbi:hypothetical protein NPIL_150201 [Nephila pilipes]|uniref:Uncharacterized protein n=1 Tax=Nephila pilipes TaxID=299642 RepID=A0A8X6U7C7_NEPPI|nr:hypothetical protein NPIL_150201 [Nephila pilipes]